MKKKTGWMIYLAGMLLLTIFWVSMTAMAPKSMVRTIMATDVDQEGRYIVYCYIPGEYKDVEIIRGAQIQSVEAEDYKKGNVVRIKFKVDEYEAEYLPKIKIYYVLDGIFRGPEENIPDEVIREGLNGYTLSESTKLGDEWQGRWAEYFFAAITSSAIGLLNPVWQILFDWLETKKGQETKKELQKKLGREITEYLATRWDSTKYFRREEWMAGEMKKMGLGMIFSSWCVIAGGGILLVWLKIRVLTLLLVILLSVVCALIRLVLFVKLEKKIAHILKEEGDKLELIWCYSELHNKDEFGSVEWLEPDLGAAEMMTCLKDYAESYSFAKLLWSVTNKKNAQGTYYLQYHFLQYRNCLHLKPEEAEEHLECVNQEINRDPDSKYAKVVKEKLNESESDKENDKENEIGN